MHEGPQPLHEGVGLARLQRGERAGEQVKAEYLAVLAQPVVSRRAQPDQRAPPVGRVSLALKQSLVRQVADDLADYRLSPSEVRARLANRQRPGHRQML